MTETVFLEEGDLQATTLALDGGDEGVVRVPGDGGGEISTRRVVDITTISERWILSGSDLRSGNRV